VAEAAVALTVQEEAARAATHAEELAEEAGVDAAAWEKMPGTAAAGMRIWPRRGAPVRSTSLPASTSMLTVPARPMASRVGPLEMP
jgi:hypothetical protein